MTNPNEVESIDTFITLLKRMPRELVPLGRTDLPILFQD